MIIDMKRKTILKHSDFSAPPDSIDGRCEFFSVKTKLSNSLTDSRYGLVVSKRIFRLAVQRNRAKRLLRDWISFNEKYMLPGLDYIFIANAEVLDAPRDDARMRMRRILKRISRTYRLYGNQK